jgi:hypothetical protein
MACKCVSTKKKPCGGVTDSPHLGICHICQQRTDINYCDRCGHWFCVPCSGRWVVRALEAVRQFFLGKREGCCGLN